MPRSQKPTSSDLFKVCRRYLKEPQARVASELLFWSQFAEHEFRGRVGFYKVCCETKDHASFQSNTYHNQLANAAVWGVRTTINF